MRHFRMFTHNLGDWLVRLGRDRDLYELMQALKVMALALPTFHSPPNTAATALRDLIVHFVHITSLLFEQPMPREA